MWCFLWVLVTKDNFLLLHHEWIVTKFEPLTCRRKVFSCAYLMYSHLYQRSCFHITKSRVMQIHDVLNKFSIIIIIGVAWGVWVSTTRWPNPNYGRLQSTDLSWISFCTINSRPSPKSVRAFAIGGGIAVRRLLITQSSRLSHTAVYLTSSYEVLISAKLILWESERIVHEADGQKMVNTSTWESRRMRGTH